MQALYQAEVCDLSVDELVEQAEAGVLLLVPEVPEGADENALVGEGLDDYARLLLEGTVDHLDPIDDMIAGAAQNWTLERMPIVDRNIIRLAVFEMAYLDEIPVGVAINEAVEVAKLFGGDDSPKFVNGVLGKIAKLFEEEH